MVSGPVGIGTQETGGESLARTLSWEPGVVSWDYRCRSDGNAARPRRLGQSRVSPIEPLQAWVHN